VRTLFRAISPLPQYPPPPLLLPNRQFFKNKNRGCLYSTCWSYSKLHTQLCNFQNENNISLAFLICWFKWVEEGMISFRNICYFFIITVLRKKWSSEMNAKCELNWIKNVNRNEYKIIWECTSLTSSSFPDPLHYHNIPSSTNYHSLTFKTLKGWAPRASWGFIKQICVLHP
jgi:hypothetical protein